MNIFDIKNGSLVRFLGKNGHDHELTEALELLEVGRVYEVESIDIGGWVSYLKLKDIATTFNSVMFEDVQ